MARVRDAVRPHIAEGVTGPSQGIRGSFRRGFAATFLFDVVSRIAGAITVVVLIRGLSVSQYAFVTLFFAIAGLATGAAGGGIRMRYLRICAENISRETAESERVSFLGALVNSSVCVILLGVVAVVGAQAMRSGFGGIRLFGCATGYALGLGASELAMFHYQAHRRFGIAGCISAARAGAVLFAAGLVVLRPSSRSLIALSFVLAMVITGVAASFEIVRGEIVGGRLRRLRLHLMGEEVWLSLYYLAAAGFASVDVLVAGALLHERQVATLGASLRYLGLAVGAIPALTAVVRVRTSQVDVVDSTIEQRRLVLAWIRRSIVPAGVLFGVAVVLAPFVIPLIDGGRYPGSELALQIYLSTAFAVYVTLPATSILMAQRRYVWLAVVETGALIINLLGDLAVAQKFGVVGIAIVSSAVYVALEVLIVAAALKGPRAIAQALVRPLV